MNQHRTLMRLAAFVVLCAGCGSPDQPTDSLQDTYGTVGSTSTTEPVAYTTNPYDFTGTTPIADLYDLVGGGNVWFGMAANQPHPIDGACDGFGTEIEQLDELPTQIEGIITLHPRYYQALGICQSEERFYGSYFIEDSTRGILVLKDSRIADFRMGDRVRLTVTGLSSVFGSTGVLTSLDEEVVSLNHEIYADYIGSDNLDRSMVGRTVTIRREISSLATNYNFSEMCLKPEGETDFICTDACVAQEQCTSPDSPARAILVSLDREIEQRDPILWKKGDVVEVTGPVTESFGLRIVVARAGQISFVNE